MTPSLEAGIARTNITPPVGIATRGFAGRGPASGVHEDLTATALVLRCGDTMAALIGLDLCLVDRGETLAWREAIAARTGVPVEHQVVAASHTHYGPAQTDRDDPLVPAYQALLHERLVAVAEEAAGRLQPVQMGVGESTTWIGVNRRERRPDGVVILGRNPDGPVDRAVLVVRLDDLQGRPVAVIANAACHPVCGTSATRELSPCWPGFARKVVEQEAGVPVLFLQGASADVNPLAQAVGHDSSEKAGAEAGAAMLAAWQAAEVAPAQGLRVTSRLLELPRYTYGSAEQASLLLEQNRRDLETTQNPGMRWWCNLQIEKLEEVLAQYRGEQVLEPMQAEVTGWKLGPLGLATCPGEIFCQIGMAVKERAPLQPTLFAAYGNGSIGYVPTPDQYAEGGYEVDRACRVDPAAAGIIEEGCLAALAEAAN
ncbi:MAG: hypothetical protein HUU35_10325 [Armatimonadetes bacterium]|nr:hypothetical protein [Armatimonadota bacterium]